MSGAHSEFAPAAIRALFAAVSVALDFPVEMGGILGDQAHTYGYHRARAVLPPDDYSVSLPRDRGGRPWAASALDITPNHAEDMPTLTKRLKAAVEARDPRMRCLREFYGTLDGTTVYGWDRHAHQQVTSDTSHLWHMHLSIHRDVACRASRLLPLAEVLAGR